MIDWLVSIPALLREPETQFSLSLTGQVVLITLLLHLIASLLLGYCLSKKSFPGRVIIDLLVTLPLVFPPVATGYALLMILGKNGPFGEWSRSAGINFIFSGQGVVLAAFLSGLPLVVKPIQSAMNMVSTRWGEVARTLGKNELQIFLFVLIPNIQRALATGLILGLGRSLGEVGITLMLGGNIAGKTNTLSLEIYNAVFSGDYQRASGLSVILGGISLVIFFLLQRCSSQRNASA